MGNLFQRIINGAKTLLGRVFSSKQLATANKIAAAVGDAMKYALPAAEFVASMTPNRTDDEIVGLLKTLNMEVPDDYGAGRAFNDMEKKGLLLQAAREALSGHLREAILDGGAAGLKLGEQKLKGLDVVPGAILDQAAQSAYTLFLSKDAAAFAEGR